MQSILNITNRKHNQVRKHFTDEEIEKEVDRIMNDEELLRRATKNHPRRIFSGCVYEVSARVMRGLPFVPTKTMNKLITNSLSLAQTTYPTTICHYVMMQNHYHMILIAQDPNDMTQFIGRFQKELTERVKNLLGLKHLKLWAGRPMIASIVDLDKCSRRVEYILSNPTKAGLVGNIESYPGLNTYEYLSDSREKAVHRVDDPYVSCKNIPNLRELLEGKQHVDDKTYRVTRKPLVIGKRMDRRICAHFDKCARDEGRSYGLEITPNAWIGVLKDDMYINDVGEINENIRRRIKSNERSYRNIRKSEGWGIIGKERLLRQPMDKEYESKRYSKKVMILCTDRQVRIRKIAEYKRYVVKRYVCSRLHMRGGVYVPWPKGCYKSKMLIGIELEP